MLSLRLLGSGRYNAAIDCHSQRNHRTVFCDSRGGVWPRSVKERLFEHDGSRLL